MRTLDKEIILKHIKVLEHNPVLLQRYLTFLETTELSEVGAIHHILPISLFPEFKNLHKNPWNGLKLSHRDHFVAHYLLYRACPGNSKMRSAFVCIARIWFQTLLDSSFEGNLLLEASLAYEKLQTLRISQVKGRVWVHSGPDALMIPKGKLQNYLSNGYEKGRGFNPNNGLVWVHSKKGARRVSPEEASVLLNAGYLPGNGLSGEKNPWFGKTPTNKTRRRMSKSAKERDHSRFCSPEEKQKRSQAAKLMWKKRKESIKQL
jgi:NUMOD3 motif